MAGRDRAAEISEVRARARWRDALAVSEVGRLGDGWAGGGGPLAGAPDYVVIRLVTLIEVFFRIRMAELIDSGAPYLERAQSLIGGPGLKIDFPLAAAISGRKISLGQLVAHSISCNSLGDFVSGFSKLFGHDLVDRIREVHDRVAVELRGEAKRPIIDDVAALRASTVRLFECRHILVHELPDAAPYETGEIDGFVAMTDQLLRATSGYIDWLLHGNYALTQSDMNAEAGEGAAAADNALGALVQRVRDETKREDFDKAQAAWEAYRAAEADFRTDWESGGSIRPLLYASAMEHLTRERMLTLEAFLSGDFGLGGQCA